MLEQRQREYLELGASITGNSRNTFAYPLTGQFAQAAVAVRQFLPGSEAPTYATVRLLGQGRELQN